MGQTRTSISRRSYNSAKQLVESGAGPTAAEEVNLLHPAADTYTVKVLAVTIDKRRAVRLNFPR